MEVGQGTLEHLPTEHRAENWARWLRYSAGADSAESLEGNYRSRQSGYWWDHEDPSTQPVQAMPSPINTFDAQLVEHAIHVMPVYHHALVLGWHHLRMRPEVLLRRSAKLARMRKEPVRTFAQVLSRAYARLDEALALPTVIRRERTRALVLKALAEG